MAAAGSGRPGGTPYDWYRRGLELLDRGEAAAAVLLLTHAAEVEPGSRAVREALARAHFHARQYAEALRAFRRLAEADPTDDYAQFGWGVSAARLGDFPVAAEHLALATAMRPRTEHYLAELRAVRATLRARAESGLPPVRGADERWPAGDGPAEGGPAEGGADEPGRLDRRGGAAPTGRDDPGRDRGDEGEEPL